MNSVATHEQGRAAKTLQVEIERILPGGVGLAHAEDLTLFVALAAPGDVVRIVIDRVQGKVGFASVVEIVKPSPVRVEPPCPYFGRCGGCDFQQLTYEAQLNAKVEIIRDCLRRIARIEPPSDIQIHSSPAQWQYRARATWQFDSISSRLGYFERGSNHVCDVEYCAVLVPELQQTLEGLRKEIQADPVTQLPKHIEVVAGDEGVSVAANIARFNARTVSRVIGKETYHFSAEGFFQINHELLEPLINEAIRGTNGVHKGGVAIDLYCGVGLFTLPLARRFESVVGIEANRRAVEFARRNLELAGLGNAEVVVLGVADWLKQHLAFEPVDFLLLDPPRSGAENAVIEGILRLLPRRIAYVSCDPATLARDLKKLIARGYSLEAISAFDMFPQTHHVEVVAHLRLQGQEQLLDTLLL
jgi:23S rRNA (uracil1939-C5)-methyltransferase